MFLNVKIKAGFELIIFYYIICIKLMLCVTFRRVQPEISSTLNFLRAKQSYDR